MDQITYERPREKLQYKGASYLTLTELMQLIIGSGMAKISGARLSKQVVRLLERGNISYGALRDIKGLGDAKACQIIAAIEIGKRLLSNEVASGSSFPIASEAILIRHDKTPRVVCYCFDGAARRIDAKSYPIHKKEHASVLLKRVFRDVVAVSARSVIVVIYKPGALALTMDAPDVVFGGILKETAALLTIEITDVFAVNGHAYVSWRALL